MERRPMLVGQFRAGAPLSTDVMALCGHRHLPVENSPGCHGCPIAEQCNTYLLMSIPASAETGDRPAIPAAGRDYYLACNLRQLNRAARRCMPHGSPDDV